MATATPAVHPVNGLVALAKSRVAHYELRFQAAYRMPFLLLSRLAASRLEAADKETAKGHPPHIDEVMPLSKVGELLPDVDQMRENIVYLIGQTILGYHGMTAAGDPIPSFTVTNPMMVGVLGQLGGKITNISEGARQSIMGVIDKGYQQGSSISQIADSIRTDGLDMANARATMIARTEMNTAVNAATLGAVQATGAAASKTWVVSPGAPHPRHELYDDLDGQSVSVDEDFDVNGNPAQHPSDPALPPEESINCRCTLIFGDESDGSDTGYPNAFQYTGGGSSMGTEFDTGPMGLGNVMEAPTPAPPPTGGRYTINTGGDAKMANEITGAMEQVQDAMGGSLPPGLPPTIVKETKWAGRDIKGGFEEVGPPSIHLNPNLSPGDLSVTLPHEYGHYLDHQVLGAADKPWTGTKESDEFLGAVGNSKAMNDLYEQIAADEDKLLAIEEGSTKYDELQAYADSEYHKYLAQTNEIWARAFTQWVATVTEDDLALKTIAKLAKTGSQWTPKDFKPIKEAIDKLFTDRGLFGLSQDAIDQEINYTAMSLDMKISDLQRAAIHELLDSSPGAVQPLDVLNATRAIHEEWSGYVLSFDQLETLINKAALTDQEKVIVQHRIQFGFEGPAGPEATEADVNAEIQKVIDERATQVGPQAGDLRTLSATKAYNNGTWSAAADKEYNVMRSFGDPATEFKKQVQRLIDDRLPKDWNWQKVRDDMLERKYSGFGDKYVQALKKDLATRQDVIKQLVSQWAGSSTDDGSVVFQREAAKLFGTKYPKWLDSSANTQIAPFSGVEKDTLDAIDQFLNAQYQATQSMLAKDGVDKVTVWRGMSISDEQYQQMIQDHALSGDKFQLNGLANPLGSWSTSLDVAEGFAEDSAVEVLDGHTIVVQVTVPRERIFSTFRSGFGCTGEREIVILGTPEGKIDEALMQSHRAPYIQPTFTTNTGNEVLDNYLETAKSFGESPNISSMIDWGNYMFGPGEEGAITQAIAKGKELGLFPEEYDLGPIEADLSPPIHDFLVESADLGIPPNDWNLAASLYMRYLHSGMHAKLMQATILKGVAEGIDHEVVHELAHFVIDVIDHEGISQWANSMGLPPIPTFTTQQQQQQ